MGRMGYRKIFDELRARISGGEWAAESALPSEHLLGAEFQVSRPTIRRALDRLVEAKLIVRRPGIGTFVASPSEIRRPKILGIGFNIAQYGSYYYTQLILDGAAQACAEHGAQLRLLSDKDQRTLRPGELDGVIAIWSFDAEYPRLAAWCRQGLPVVLINRRATDFPELSSLWVDYFAESRHLVRHALNAGFRRIAVIGSEDSSRVYGERTAGWRAAHLECGLEPDAGLQLPVEQAFDINRIADFLRRHRPEVLFITTGEFINLIQIALIAAKIRSPEEIKLLCFDDLDFLCGRQALPVAYIQMPLRRMGEAAASYLLTSPPGTPAVHRVFAANYVFASGASLLL